MSVSSIQLKWDLNFIKFAELKKKYSQDKCSVPTNLRTIKKEKTAFDLCILADSNWTDHFKNSQLAN